MNSHYKSDEWNSWTEKSHKIPFKSTTRTNGDGENKVGAEYKTKPLGQNYSYDLNMPFNEKWECKKLDSGNSFRLGVDVSVRYTPIINNMIHICTIISDIKDELLDDTVSKQEIIKWVNVINEKTTKCKTSLIHGLIKHEVSHSNLSKSSLLIEGLKKLIFIDENEKVLLYSSFDGKEYEYSLNKAFDKLSLECIHEQDKILKIGGREKYNRLLITKHISTHIMMFNNCSLYELLNQIVREEFREKKLILVEQIKGYKPVTKLDAIVCNRITSGKPRCKYNL
jgi:hypothetical protein